MRAVWMVKLLYPLVYSHVVEKHEKGGANKLILIILSTKQHIWLLLAFYLVNVYYLIVHYEMCDVNPVNCALFVSIHSNSWPRTAITVSFFSSSWPAKQSAISLIIQST